MALSEPPKHTYSSQSIYNTVTGRAVVDILAKSQPS